MRSPVGIIIAEVAVEDWVIIRAMLMPDGLQFRLFVAGYIPLREGAKNRRRAFYRVVVITAEQAIAFMLSAAR